MLAKTPSSADAQLSIHDERLAALKSPAEERLGLSEVERKKVFVEIANAEKRAEDDARARVPDSEVMKQIELQRELEKTYKDELARRYTLTQDDLTKIGLEGVKKGWAY
jgi:hypothetical protein